MIFFFGDTLKIIVISKIMPDLVAIIKKIIKQDMLEEVFISFGKRIEFSNSNSVHFENIYY